MLRVPLLSSGHRPASTLASPGEQHWTGRLCSSRTPHLALLAARSGVCLMPSRSALSAERRSEVSEDIALLSVRGDAGRSSAGFASAGGERSEVREEGWSRGVGVHLLVVSHSPADLESQSAMVGETPPVLV